jgi:hypothetical protein
MFIQDIAIRCAEASGCFSISMSHFTHLLGAGSLELLLEIPMIIRIYKDKNGKEEKEGKK